jgi:hypothetical protein
MSGTLNDKDWEDLLGSIADQQSTCTPIIGAGTCAGTLPLASQIAQEWADEHDYPLADATDLARVAQFLAIDRHDMFPRDEIRKRFEEVAPPDFSQPDEPHSVLADLKLPIYITTNYDDFMMKALEDRGRNPKRELCRWNDYPKLVGEKSVFDDPEYKPTPEEPVVFHLHGHTGLPQTMVLTEGDYLDFLIRFARDDDLLPSHIRMALMAGPLLFIGYSLADWNFRVILRGLRGQVRAEIQYPAIAVQLPPDRLSGEEMEQAQGYLDQYLGTIGKIRKVHYYWGEARQFARELRERWEARCHESR